LLAEAVNRTQPNDNYITDNTVIKSCGFGAETTLSPKEKRTQQGKSFKQVTSRDLD